MYKKILIALSIFSAAIFDKTLENIFIIIFSVGVYALLVKKDFKDVLKSLVVGYIILNLVVVVFYKDKINYSIIENNNLNKDKKAIVLVYQGEDKLYNLKERAREIYENDKIYSIFTSAYKLNRYKSMYNNLGSSDFKRNSYDFRKKLTNKLDNEYIVINANLHTKPYLETVVSDLVNKGYKDIIFCPMFLTEGKEYKIFEKRLNDMELIKYGVKTKITEVFFNSHNIATLYKDYIMNYIIEKDDAVGILLVGFKEQNDLNQDVSFREKIKKYLLMEDGYNMKIKLALLENHKKDIIKVGNELLEYGIDILFLVIPTSLFETIQTRSLAEYIFNKLDISDETKYYYVGPVNSNDLLVEELHKKIRLIENQGGV
ncbi:hypothetical protein SAMN05661008_01748 [Alkalithermobacter thermoalcaliphilus JW-YL-7 = DSM 7308]|uniref:Ferrochelatase n=1 Tax=Alkalithermobacter thermoalcaliphilus JW-YL-7 = DSM 7308 TaxID=1121328 RepID=A0A150FPK3_CLOPD|nr:ferrochelatase [[Clostridium] paradoxum JW-YL-7 = DSM 7308]SHL25127.1 hypothetical protein SAMN05661008_01748 [[Clostridium] paradoxum JW-YL-7 = DSM 7308]